MRNLRSTRRAGRLHSRVPRLVIWLVRCAREGIGGLCEGLPGIVFPVLNIIYAPELPATGYDSWRADCQSSSAHSFRRTSTINFHAHSNVMTALQTLFFYYSLH